jgi:putative DNA primase/helicase
MNVINQSVIPSELRALPQWVCWRYEDRDGKPTKPPINPKSNGKLLYAKSNDPATWSDFDTACAAATRLRLGGVGLNLSESDNLTGLDLDHVLDPETLELDPLAVEVLARFAGTYVEVSPSGAGLRIWCYGKAARSGKCDGSRKWLEVYTHPSNRYLTVTGNRYGAAMAVTEQQEALDWLHSRFMETSRNASTEDREIDLLSPPVGADLSDDAMLLNKARNAKNGSAFDALWSGDLSSHNNDASATDMALLNLLAFWTGNDAARMDRLFRQSGLMRPKWDELHGATTYGDASIGKAISGCRNVYTGLQPILTASVEPINPYRGTDDANADLFLHQHGQDVRFCPPWDKWLLWSGSHWRIDDRLDIDRLTADLPRHLYKCAADSTDSDQRKRIAKLANQLEKVSLRNNLLIAARHKVVVHHSELDQGHFLLNVSNGTVDLTTGQLCQHRRNDLITHSIEIPFNPNATAPIWLAFLNSVFGGDADLIRFVQRAVGYSLTGDVREQILLICCGVGSNGKSVFLNILQKLLELLAWQAAPDLLMADKQRRHPTEQADLYGKRAIICQETGEGRRFNETLVKQLTGGDTITARRMHEDFWQFKPTHKLWLSTNHRPEIKGTDFAIWRRIRLIPFNVKFTDDGNPRKDPDMERKLTAELPGILAWAVAGCLDWQRHGLQQPAAVKAATDAYQNDMDTLAAWLGDCCVVIKSATAKAADLYRSYVDWCEESGERPETQKKWGMRLTERGFEREARRIGIFYSGIGLRSLQERGEREPCEPCEPKKAIFQADLDHEAKTAIYGSHHSHHSHHSQPNPLPPVETKTCARCRHLTPAPDGGGCGLHGKIIAAINIETCDDWQKRGLIRCAQ